jgi:hypothetical protein
MFGLLKDAAEFVGDAVGTVAGIAVAPIAVALGVSETMVRRAIKAGCRTQREIREWIEENG